MKNILPVLILKNLLILPNQEVKIELNNELSKNIINIAKDKYKSEIIILSPKDQIEEIPDVEDLPQSFVVAKIKSFISLPNENLRVTLRGLFRAKQDGFTTDSFNHNILKCKYKKLEIPEYKKEEALAIKRKLNTLVKRYVNNASNVSNSILGLIKDISDLNKLTDIIASFMPLEFERKFIYIEEINPVNRGIALLDDLHFELEVLKLDKKLEDKLRIRLENNQKEFILTEKLHEIEEELGTENLKTKEVKNYLNKLNNLNITDEIIIDKIKNEIKKFELMSESSPEVTNITNYLDWMLNLPWNKHAKEEKDLKIIRKNLDKTHYGMDNIKDKIIEYIAAKNRSENLSAPIICLVGPPGTGKTSIAKSISKSLNREYFKISVGGLNDSSVLNGHRRTYLGANPGKIIEALKRTNTNNPVILIDEVDKMVNDHRGNPSSVLLDILDKKQNKNFVDNYIEEKVDLSHILFILTANNKNNIPYELLDRLEIIEISSYTTLEKEKIATKYILPKIYKEHNIAPKSIKFSEKALNDIIIHYTYDSGLRELKRILTEIIRKLIIMDNINNVNITSKIVQKILGPFKYENILINNNKPGTINSLAVTNSGGIVTQIESVFYEGKGNFKITGMLEKVMSESVYVCVSYIRSNLKYFGINNFNLNEMDIHIHFLDASTKKDGPSAGISITTSLLSLALQKEINNKICMTGEVTLNGNIKKIGGIKEKLIGAYNNGMDTVFIPKENHLDLQYVPKEVLKKLKIIEVTNYKEIYNKLFN